MKKTGRDSLEGEDYRDIQRNIEEEKRKKAREDKERQEEAYSDTFW